MRKKMLPSDHYYTHRVTWSEEGGEYVGLCAEFPSLSRLASEPEVGLHGLRQVVSYVVADLQANGESVPEPLAAKKIWWSVGGTRAARITSAVSARGD